eukprot:5372564-Pyramimonas_sp.AAC.1
MNVEVSAVQYMDATWCGFCARSSFHGAEGRGTVGTIQYEIAPTDRTFIISMLQEAAQSVI